MKPTIKLIILMLSIATVLGAYRLISKPAPVPASASTPSAGSTIAPTATDIALAVNDSSPITGGSSPVLLAPDIASNEWQLVQGSGQMQDSVVSSSVAGHPFARHIVVKQAGAKLWDLQIAHPLNVALKQGTHIQFSYFARSADSCSITAVVEQNAAPYATVVAHDEALTPEWKEYSLTWVQTSDTPENWAKADFQVGEKVGVTEITGVTIRKLAQ